MRKIAYLFSILKLLLFCYCQNTKKQLDYESEQTLQIIHYKTHKIKLKQEYPLAKISVNYIKKEYPNKLNQTLVGADELKSPRELHPAFCQCFDWHPSIHGHWSLVSLRRQFSNLENRTNIEDMLLSYEGGHWSGDFDHLRSKIYV